MTQPHEMIDFFTKSLENEGASVCTYYYLGVAKYDSKDFRGAVDDFTKAINTESRYRNVIKLRDDLKDNPTQQEAVDLTKSQIQRILKIAGNIRTLIVAMPTIVFKIIRLQLTTILILFHSILTTWNITTQDVRHIICDQHLIIHEEV